MIYSLKEDLRVRSFLMGKNVYLLLSRKLIATKCESCKKKGMQYPGSCLSEYCFTKSLSQNFKLMQNIGLLL